MLRLVLLALARNFLSRYETNRYVVQALHGHVQHGGIERAFLQMAKAQHGEKLAPQCSGRFSLFGESESIDHA
jgi:hypothetical protein